MPLPSWFSLSYLSKFSPKIQAHNLLQRQAPYNHEDVTDLVTTKKAKNHWCPNLPIQLICHFSLWTKHKGTLEQKTEISIYMQDQYLSVTSNVNLSPIQSHVIYELGHKLWHCGGKWAFTNTVHRINKSSKPYGIWKINKLTFTKIYW